MSDVAEFGGIALAPLSAEENPDGSVSLRSSQIRGELEDFSGVIADANVAQEVLPANPTRRAIMFFNLSSSDMWVSLVGDAEASAPGSIKISGGSAFAYPGGFGLFVPSNPLSVVCATDEAPFTCWTLEE